MQRRHFLCGLVSALCVAVTTPLSAIAASFGAKITKSDKDWKAVLTREQYNILRQSGTEIPYTSKLLNEHRNGVFLCAGCDLPLFASNAKFDSGTGWPSFYQPIAQDHLETKIDFDIGMERTEFHCARCGGHHGHVFPDGPNPTGLRYCSNGAVLKFVAKV